MRGIIMSTTLCISFLGCNESDFSASSKKKPVTKPDQPAVAIKSDPIIETFTLDASKRAPVDLVWTIDNSGSMSDNIAQVRKNFDAFMASLASSVDVRVILISKSTGTYGLKLPTSASGGTQIDYEVASLDAALIAAAASCPVIAGASANTICGVPHRSRLKNAAAITGAAAAVFRPDAARSYVFVTDDESADMPGNDFVAVLKATKAVALPKVYSFRGINRGTAGCSISRVGVQYGIMESATGGKAFDICDHDWSSSFSQLAESITSSVSPTVTLKGKFDPKTIKVMLDGAELPVGEYELNGQIVTLKNPPDLKTAHEIKITYIPLVADGSPQSKP